MSFDLYSDASQRPFCLLLIIWTVNSLSDRALSTFEEREGLPLITRIYSLIKVFVTTKMTSADKISPDMICLLHCNAFMCDGSHCLICDMYHAISCMLSTFTSALSIENTVI